MAHSHRSLEIHQQPLDVGVHSAYSITLVVEFSQPGVDFLLKRIFRFQMCPQEMPKYNFQNQESSASLAYTSKCEPEVERTGMCSTQIKSYQQNSVTTQIYG